MFRISRVYNHLHYNTRDIPLANDLFAIEKKRAATEYSVGKLIIPYVSRSSSFKNTI